MISWRTVAIRLRNHVSRYDGLHAGYGYLQLRHQAPTRSTGKPIGNMDLLIASHAVSQGLTLVTNDVKHFSNVPGLKVEVWG
jgi:predicted nucleic acid-binding protein